MEGSKPVSLGKLYAEVLVAQGMIRILFKTQAEILSNFNGKSPEENEKEMTEQFNKYVKDAYDSMPKE